MSQYKYSETSATNVAQFDKVNPKMIWKNIQTNSSQSHDREEAQLSNADPNVGHNIDFCSNSPEKLFLTIRIVLAASITQLTVFDFGIFNHS